MTYRNFIGLFVIALFAGLHRADAADGKSKATPAASKLAALEIAAGDSSPGSTLLLRGSDARRQLLVTAKFEGGSARDYARHVKYEVKPANIMKVDAAGFVTPVAD